MARTRDLDRDLFEVVEKTRELIVTNRALRATLADTGARSREVATAKLFALRGGAEEAPESPNGDEASLRERVRAFLRSGLLPPASPEVWAGVRRLPGCHFACFVVWY